MEFIKEDNKVYKILKIEVSKDLRLEEIEREITKLQEEKDALNLVK